MFQDPVGLSNELSCEAGSFSCRCNPHSFLQPEVLRLYCPTLEPWVVWPVSLPSCFSLFFRTQMWDHLVLQPLPCGAVLSALATPLCPSYPSGWSLFFDSLVFRLPYSLIFWKFWLFFVFKFVVVLLLVVWGGKVYLPTSPSWPEVLLPFSCSDAP